MILKMILTQKTIFIITYTLMQEKNLTYKRLNTIILDLKLQFDIIAISETWTDPDLIDDFNINNHDAYQVTRGIRRGGGVAIYTNKELCMQNGGN